MKEYLVQIIPIALSFALGLMLNMGEKSATLNQLTDSTKTIELKLDSLSDRMNTNDRVLAGTIQQLQDQQKFLESQIERLQTK